jgi:hypothetical protein
MTRPAEARGFKIGEGPNGGMSFFGTDPNKRDGFVVQSVFLSASLSLSFNMEMYGAPG